MNSELKINVNADHSLLSAFEKLTTSRQHNRGTINVVKSDLGGVARLECVNHHFWPWNTNSTAINTDMVKNLREALKQVISDELASQFEVMLKHADSNKRHKLEGKIKAVLDAFDKAISKVDDEGRGEALSRVEISKFVGNVKLLRNMTSVEALLKISNEDLARMAARKSMTKETQNLKKSSTGISDQAFQSKQKSVEAFKHAEQLIRDPRCTGENIRTCGQKLFNKAFPEAFQLQRRTNDLVDLDKACKLPVGFDNAQSLARDVDDAIVISDLPGHEVLDEKLKKRARECLNAYRASPDDSQTVETFFKDMTDILEAQRASLREDLEEVRKALKKAGFENLQIDERGQLVNPTKEDFIKLLDIFSAHGGGDLKLGEGLADDKRTALLEEFGTNLQNELGPLTAPQPENVEDADNGTDEVSEATNKNSQKEEMEFRRNLDISLSRISPLSTNRELLLSSAGERIMAVIVPNINDEIRGEKDDESRQEMLAKINGKIQARYPSLAFEDGPTGVHLAGGKDWKSILADVKAMFRDFMTGDGDFPYEDFGSRKPKHREAIGLANSFAYVVSGARPHSADVLRTDYVSERELHLENSEEYTDEQGGINLDLLKTDIQSACRGKHFRHAFAYAIDRFTKKFDRIELEDAGQLSDYVESLKAFKVMFNSTPAANAKDLCGKVIDALEAREEYLVKDDWGDQVDVKWRVRSETLLDEIKKVLNLVANMYGKNVTLP